MVDADSTVDVEPRPDDWDKQAASFEFLVSRFDEREGVWPVIIAAARDDPLHGPIFGDIDELRRTRPFRDAVSAFPTFVKWWALRGAIPVDLDPQSPADVAAWLETLANRVGGLWSWYLAKLAKRGHAVEVAGVFGPVAMRAREVVVVLTAPGLAPMPSADPSSGLGAFAAQRYLLDELRPFLRKATGFDDTVSLSSAAEPDATAIDLGGKVSGPEVAPPNATGAKRRTPRPPSQVLVKCSAARGELFFGRDRFLRGQVPGSMWTLFTVRVADAAQTWLNKGGKEVDGAIPSEALMVRAEGRYGTDFRAWWLEKYGGGDPLIPARKSDTFLLACPFHLLDT